MKKTITFFLILTSFQYRAPAAVYYVAPSGNDSYPGTQAQPFQTISKAALIMIPGDTCFIMQGIYRETVLPQNSGASGQYITYKSFENDTVIITGNDTITNWTWYKGNIFKAYVPDTVFQLFVNGVQAPRGVYPDVNASTYYGTAAWAAVNAATTGGTVAFSGANFAPGYWNGGTCLILTGYKWVVHDGIIDSTYGNTVRCTVRSSPWSTNNAGYLGSGSGYITNHLNTVTGNNEWHWQHDTLYYYLPTGLSISSLRIEARKRIYGFICDNKSYVSVKNLHFFAAAPSFKDVNYCSLEGGSVWYPDAFFYFNNGWVRNLPATYDTQTLADSWEAKGVFLSGYNSIIKDCYVANAFGDGISVGGTNNTVDNCLIENCSMEGVDAAALSACGYDLKVYHCTMKNSGRSILVHRGARRMEIKYNDLGFAGLTTLDLGLTYSFHTNGDSTEIAFNWVHDNLSTGTSCGIYLDNYDTGYVVHHNVIWNVKNAIQTNKPAVNHQIYNNTAWACTNAMGTWGNAGTYIVNQRLFNNLSDKAWNQYTAQGNNLVSANPLFVDATNHDFHLLPGSPAIDYGTQIPPFTNGYAGLAPDAGAYENSGTDWTPGSNVVKPDLSHLLVPPVIVGIKNIVHGKISLEVYPSPADEYTGIYYSLPENVDALSLSIYSYSGRLVASPVYQAKERGDHQFILDTHSYPEGSYVCVLRAGNQSRTFRFVIIR